jgi:hypothetical protein
MSIVRKGKRSRFVIVTASTVCDKDLSHKALGLLVRILQKPDNWVAQEAQIAAEYPKDGTAAVRSALNELKKRGYIVRERHHGEGGLFRWEQVVYESPDMALAAKRERVVGTDEPDEDPSPLVDFPQVVEPHVDQPHVDEPLADYPSVENAPSNKEGSNKDLGTRNGATAPGPPGDPSAFQASLLSDPSPQSHGPPHPPSPPPPAPSQNGHSSKAADTAGIVQRVFEAWKATLPSASRHELTDARSHVIKAALKRYPLADVLDAVCGWTNDPWPERAQHNDITQLLWMGSKRKPANVLEKMRDLARRANRTNDAAFHADPDEEFRRARKEADQEEARLQAARFPSLNQGQGATS